MRKEDANFIRGQGSYVDDIKLPGMLFGAIVRSPYAHARIKGIDKAKALACPGVVAVLIADDLKPVNLHWMPTLGGDVQAVLADKKVCFQYQEVAMVLASDRYAADDGAAAGRSRLRGAAGDRRPEEVDGARRADHPRGHRRTRRKSATARARTRTTSSPGKRATRRPPTRRSRRPKSRCSEEILNPRVHPCPLETCGCVASFDKTTG